MITKKNTEPTIDKDLASSLEMSCLEYRLAYLIARQIEVDNNTLTPQREKELEKSFNDYSNPAEMICFYYDLYGPEVFDALIEELS